MYIILDHGWEKFDMIDLHICFSPACIYNLIVPEEVRAIIRCFALY